MGWNGGGMIHKTLIDILTKSVERNGKDWDKHLPYNIYFYKSSLQQLTILFVI